MIHKVISFLVLFSLLFGPRMKILDVMQASNILLFMVAIFYIFIVKKKIERPIFVYVVLCLLASLYSFLIVGIYGFADNTVFKLLSFLFFHLGSAYIIVSLYRYSYPTDYQNKICLHIFVSGIINGFFVIAVFASGSLRNAALSLLDYSQNQLMWSEMGRRSFDLNMGGGAGASVVFSFVFMIGVALLNKQDKLFLLKISGLVILFIATLLTGRTGLIFIMVYIPMYVILSRFTNGKNSIHKTYNLSFFKTVKLSYFLLFLFGVMALFWTFVASDDIKDRYINNIQPWAFEFYYSYIESGTISTGSTNVIVNEMYFIPDSGMHLFFGDSNMGRTQNLEYVPSDVGYIRFIFGIGILGLILVFLPLLFLGLYSYNNQKLGVAPSLLLFMIIGVFISNFKELDYMSRGSGLIILLLFITTVFESKSSYQTESGGA